MAHPLYEVLISMPGIRGPGRRRPCWPRPWTRTSRHRRPAGLLRRVRSRHTPLRLIDPWQGASATAATRGLSAPCSPPPSPHCAPTPSPGPTTSANETKANRLGPGRPRPGPPPHPDPAHHDPQRRPLRPPTSHETTHRRLTHHIGAPPPVSTTLHTCQRSAAFTHRLCNSRPHLVNNGGAETKWNNQCQDPKQIYHSID